LALSSLALATPQKMQSFFSPFGARM